MLRYLIKKILIAYLSLVKKSKLSYGVNINFNTHLEGSNSLSKGAILNGAKIGFATFVGRDSYLPFAQIRRYCSIANNVEVITRTHPSSKFVSTHPAFYSQLKQSCFTFADKQYFIERLSVDAIGKTSIIIGNDVSIGARATLMGGIVVGDGGIVAAGALVTKDVPPYAIVAGVPAKIIRMRFSDLEIQYLVSLKWWHKSDLC